MENKTLTKEQVAAAVAEAKVRLFEAGRARMNAVLELAVNKDFMAPAKSLVSAAFSEIESIIDGAFMTAITGLTLPELQEARREYFRSRGRGRAPEVEPEVEPEEQAK